MGKKSKIMTLMNKFLYTSIIIICACSGFTLGKVQKLQGNQEKFLEMEEQRLKIAKDTSAIQKERRDCLIDIEKDRRAKNSCQESMEAYVEGCMMAPNSDGAYDSYQRCWGEAITQPNSCFR